MPVSRVERAIVEVAADIRPLRLGRVVDDAVAGKHTSYSRIGSCLSELARRGKPGVRALAGVLDERGGGYVPPESELEHALFAVLVKGGLPPPRRQVPLPGRGAVVGLADGAYVDERVLLEADGRRWHSRIRDLKRDHQRDAEAARVGWLTLRFLYEQIRYEAADVCATVADVLRTRAA
jgi:very-short-patch-repair endonuclease